jgi:hypothetical protein
MINIACSQNMINTDNNQPPKLLAAANKNKEHVLAAKRNNQHSRYMSNQKLKV